MRSSPFRALRGAFSLIELIVVITIIALISLFVIPAASTIILGSDITRASQIMTGQLSLARQTALTKNHAVEVRFLKYADPEVPGEQAGMPDTGRYRAIQLMEVLENGTTTTVGKLERLPGNVIMAAAYTSPFKDTHRLSSLLDTTGDAESGASGGAQRPMEEIDASSRQGDRTTGSIPVDNPPLPKMKAEDAKKYKFVSFRFLADGSTNLSTSGKWYVTIYGANDENKIADNGQPGVNYFTVQVDSSTGAVRTFRPTAGTKETGGTNSTP